MGAYCLRSAYAVFERVLTPKIEARKLLFYFYFFTHSFTLPDLTSAFGGQHSIQLSYGCLRQGNRRLAKRAQACPDRM